MIYYKTKNFELRIEENDEFTKDFIDILNTVDNNKDSQLCRIPLLQPKKTDEHNLIFAIITDIGNKPAVVGRVSLEYINYINRTAELKVFMKPANQGKGIGLEACKLVVEHGFNQLGLNRIYAGTLDSNEGFKKIAEKLGMKEEGRRLKAVWKNGKFVDVIEYGLLRSDFYAESNGEKVES